MFDAHAFSNALLHKFLLAPVLAAALLPLGIGPLAVRAGLPVRSQPGHSLASPNAHARVFVQPGAHVTPILSLIRRARTSVRLEVYLLTNRTLIRELGRAKQRGVSVRVLLEEHPFGSSRSARLGYSALRNEGVPVRWGNESAFRFTHEKAMEVDGKIAGIFTSNLTSSGIFRNREFGVIDQSGQDAGTLQSIFNSDWNRRKSDLRKTGLIVSPNNSRSRLDRLIDGTRRNLEIYAEEVQDPGIESHLAQAVRRGVKVRLITSNQSEGTQALLRSGVQVAIVSTPYIHAKAIVGDRNRVFVGSENLSSTSLDQNREVGILLNDSRAAGVVERTFEIDWAKRVKNSPPPPISPGTFEVHVQAQPDTVARGQRLTITVSTSKGAQCSIRVTYADGYVSHAKALSEIRTVGPSGLASWSWRVGTKVPGTSKAAVTCTVGSESKTGMITFRVG